MDCPSFPDSKLKFVTQLLLECVKSFGQKRGKLVNNMKGKSSKNYTFIVSGNSVNASAQSLNQICIIQKVSLL